MLFHRLGCSDLEWVEVCLGRRDLEIVVYYKLVKDEERGRPVLEFDLRLAQEDLWAHSVVDLHHPSKIHWWQLGYSFRKLFPTDVRWRASHRVGPRAFLCKKIKEGVVLRIGQAGRKLVAKCVNGCMLFHRLGRSDLEWVEVCLGQREPHVASQCDQELSHCAIR